MHQTHRASVLALLLTTAATAQNLSLDRVGGALGGPTSFPLVGMPNEPYVVLFDIIEQTTPLPALGITLDITDELAWLAFSLPTFFATTNATGHATASLVLPNDPFFLNLRLSFQAIAGNGVPYRVSNLVRLTPQLSGTFAPTLEQPSVPIAGGGAAAVGNGEFLLVGGSGPVAQRYLSRTEQWQLAGATFGVGLLSQTTGLPDGRVLFTGGLDLTTGQPTAAAAVYDPATQTTTTLTMSAPRAGHGASVMGNGKVLITGGLASFDLNNPLSLFTGIQGTTEIFDPALGTFTAGPTLLEPRALHTSTTLTTGQVLIAGGIALLPIVNIPNVSATAYRFDPATNSFGLPALFGGGRFLHSAAPLSNGKVLLVGGLTLDLTTFLTTGNLADLILGTRSDCQVYTPSFLGFGTFATVNGMQVGRAGAAVAQLDNGAALIAGGFQLAIDVNTQTFVATSTATADVFTQSPNAIAPTGSMATARLFPLAIPQPDGTTLIVGGGGGAEVYQR